MKRHAPPCFCHDEPSKRRHAREMPDIGVLDERERLRLRKRTLRKSSHIRLRAVFQSPKDPVHRKAMNEVVMLVQQVNRLAFAPQDEVQWSLIRSEVAASDDRVQCCR